VEAVTMVIEYETNSFIEPISETGTPLPDNDIYVPSNPNRSYDPTWGEIGRAGMLFNFGLSTVTHQMPKTSKYYDRDRRARAALGFHRFNENIMWSKDQFDPSMKIDTDFDPAANIPEGYEPFSDVFIDNAGNSADIPKIKGFIDTELEAWKTINNAGFTGWLSMFAIGAADPIQWALPVGRLFGASKGLAAFRAAKGAMKAGEMVTAKALLNSAKILGVTQIGKRALSTGIDTAIGATVQEAIVQNSLVTKSKIDSAIDVALSGMLGGILGAAAGKLTSMKYNRMAKSLEIPIKNTLDPNAIHVDPGAIHVGELERYEYTPEAFEKKIIEVPRGLDEFESHRHRTLKGNLDNTQSSKGYQGLLLEERILDSELSKLQEKKLPFQGAVSPVTTTRIVTKIKGEIRKLSPREAERVTHLQNIVERDPRSDANVAMLKREQAVYDKINEHRIGGKELAFLEEELRNIRSKKAWFVSARQADAAAEELAELEALSGKKFFNPKSKIVHKTAFPESDLLTTKEVELLEAESGKDLTTRYTHPERIREIENRLETLRSKKAKYLSTLEESAIIEEIKQLEHLGNTKIQKEHWEQKPGATRKIHVGGEAPKGETLGKFIEGKPLKSHKDVHYEGIPVDQLSFWTPEDGMKPLTEMDDSFQNAPIFGLDWSKYWNKIPILRKSIPDIYMAGRILNTKAQKIYYSLMPSGTVQKRLLKGKGQLNDAYSKIILDNDKLLGDIRKTAFSLYNKYIERVKGKSTKILGEKLGASINSAFSGKETLSMQEFLAEAIRYRRRRYYGLDNYDVPDEVKEFERHLGKSMFEPFAKWGLESGYLPKRIAREQEYIDTYTPQLLNNELMEADITETENLIMEIFAAQSKRSIAAMTNEEIAKLQDDARKFIRDRTDRFDGYRGKEEVTGSKSRYLRPRELRVPHDRPDLYERLEPYLIDDAFDIADSYMRHVNPDRILDRIYPNDPGLYKLQATIKADYDDMLTSATSKSERAAIQDEMDTVIPMIEQQVDRMRGLNPKFYQEPEWVWRSVSAIKSIQNIRLLGGVAITNLNDTVKLITDAGLRRTLKNIGSWMINPSEFNMKARDAQKLLGIYETVLNTNYSLMADITKPTMGMQLSKAEKGINALQGKMGQITGLNLVTQINKTLAAINSGDQLAHIARKYRDKGTLTKRQMIRAEELGLDLDELPGIANLIDEFSEKNKFTTYLRLDSWGEENRALTGRIMQGLKRDINRTITTINPNTLPMIYDGTIGRALLHLRTFDLASTTMTLIRQLQIGDVRSYLYLASLITMASQIGVIKRWIKGQDLKLDDPGFLIADGFDRSGAFGLFATVNGVMDRSMNIGLTSALSGDTKSLRYGEQSAWAIPFGTFTGLGEDVVRGGLSPAKSLLHGKPLTRSQIKNFWGLWPYSNVVWWNNRVLNAKELATDATAGQEQKYGRRGGFR